MAQGRDWTGRDGIGRDEAGRDGMARDWTRSDGTKSLTDHKPHVASGISVPCRNGRGRRSVVLSFHARPSITALNACKSAGPAGRRLRRAAGRRAIVAGER